MRFFSGHTALAIEYSLSKGNICIRLMTCFTGLGSSSLMKLHQQQVYLFGSIQASQTGDQPYGDISPYEMSEYSLLWLLVIIMETDSQNSGRPL